MTAASIVVNVDPTNPGQFFACCGLLELADRLFTGAEGWFSDDGKQFQIQCDGTLKNLLAAFSNSKMESSLTDSGLKRLGQLLSANKATLSEHDKSEKQRLRSMWQRERVTIADPFNFSLDWWWDTTSGVKALKTWAAKQFVMEIVRPMLVAIQKMKIDDADPSNCLTQIEPITGLPFYFDAMNNTQNTPRDNGFAPADVKQISSDRPLIELLTFIALQRFRPRCKPRSHQIVYATWNQALPPAVAAAAASGFLEMKHQKYFDFRMLYRTEYMKAVLPAIPLSIPGV